MNRQKWLGIALIAISLILILVANSDYVDKIIKIILNFSGVILGSIGGHIIGRTNSVNEK